MSQQHFTHLHLHTDFSLLDGAISLDRLVRFGKEQNLKALGITDHGNIFGAVKFFQKCKKENIKPILGCEMYFTEDVTIKSAEKKYYHLILLVQNAQGYKNLCKLTSYAFQEGFYFKPRIDYAALEKYSEGLIATTACLGGHIPNLLMKDQYDEADKRIDWFLNTFGPERFYLEVQPEDQEEQKILNDKLFKINAEKNVPLLATGDCHYATQDDHEAHEVMLAVQTQAKITDPDRFTFGDCRVYMRTAQEMLECFPNHPEAIWNSGKIADMCDFDFETGKLFFPQFEIPQKLTREEYFSQLCNKGLQTLINQGFVDKEKEQIYQERLNLELDLIISMGFAEYFLVVSDFIQWSKRNGIPVGPGRGSAAGSLVSWALEITNIDPIKYNLLFERFLNPERVTMPDIDIDFCIEGREKVIQYVRDKYGHDKVGQIITFGTMMAKGVLKDVARTLGIPFEDANTISNLIPDQLKITLQEALEQEPRLKELMEGNPKVAKLFELAFKLEGLTRHASKHAAGIVITPEPISESLPIFIPPKSTDIVTQYAMTELESLGFLKMDLLGLKNLTLIDRVVRLIKQHHNVTIDVDKLPLDDAKTFELICQGKTSGVFQLESDGLKEVLRKLKPEKFEDIIAVNALYRPGPLGSGMVDDFIERKHGRQKITYLFPELEPILQETYGVIVYQEQVMKIASAIGGYSLGQSDILRRAMGKKKVEVMAEQRQIFLEKSQERKFDGKKAGELFDLMAYFAGYGFNKSHSAAYALIAYQTAYLKANYPAEFMACLISLEATHPDKMTFYLQEAKEMGIGLLPPDINRSEIEFTVHDGNILFGLRGIKNVGLAALEAILHERTDKPYTDLMDFCIRVDLRTANKRVIESLICAGAFDTLPGSRAQQFNEIETIIEQSQEYKKRLETGQMGLFDIPSTSENGEIIYEPYAFKTNIVWDDKQILEKEREVIGFYLSSHPLDSYKQHLQRLTLSTFTQLQEKAEKLQGEQEPFVTACGLIKTHKTIMTKKQDKMAFVTLEDMNSSAEIVIFPKLFKKVEPWLASYTVFIVKGTLDSTSTQLCKIKANELVPVELFYDKWPQIFQATIHMPDSFDAKVLESVKASLSRGTVPLHVVLKENDQLIRIKTKQRVLINAEVMQELENKNIQIALTL